MSTAASDIPDMTDAEWQQRVDLAASYRLFVKYGWTDLIFTHLSARVPGQANQYLINPYGLLFEEITASSLIKVDFDGNVIAGDYPVNGAGHTIHTAVLRARPEINVVFHSHTRAGMTVSTQRCGLLPLTQFANQVMDEVAYHPYDIAAGEEECRRLGADLGDKHLMVLNNHGLLSCGRDAAEAFLLLYNLEMACKVQVDALASNQELTLPDEKVTRAMAAMSRVRPERPYAASQLAWPALIRMLDRDDPSYQD